MTGVSDGNVGATRSGSLDGNGTALLAQPIGSYQKRLQALALGT